MATDYDILHRLYIERLTGTISPEDRALLKSRLEDDLQAKKIWEELQAEGNDSDIQQFLDSLRPEEELTRLKGAFLRVPGKKAAVRLMTRYAAAAAILILLMAGAWWIWFKNRKITDNQAIASLIKQNKSTVHLQIGTGQVIDLQDKRKEAQLKVGATTLSIDSNKLSFSSADTALNLLSIPQGESYAITLADGSSVLLNADSRLRFPFRFTQSTREVYLEGEAYFKVAKDDKHPFIVHTPLTKVEVMGTEFDINTYKKGVVSTALIEGKVRTAQPDGGLEKTLLPGQAALYNITEGFNIEPIDRDDVLAWMKGVYYFHDLSFDDLAGAISRIYGVAITFDNTSIGNRSVSGVMDKNNLPELLEDLRSTAGIKYYYSGKTLHIY
ncbi:MAG: hypothetical protein BGO55_31460 [Sphingobacteriales bacterium 50-39]|nr:FecR domain-containing protein [Sphingobacteriales bacterium]OJW61022.1 MAG: hypothetical protein BGO55_31460 [Sphingobacteriales bacterium 50-39]